MKKILPAGKLDYDLLEKLLNKYSGKQDPRVITGPRLGEDAAVIDFPDRYLVAKSDPVTFTAEQIGWYAVQVNANDIATRGAVPRWFQAAILLPENNTTVEMVEGIFSQISAACNDMNITVIGGHTEVTHDLDRPIISGFMLGEVKKNKLVSTSGAKPGDVIILTKGIAIEGTSIIATEKHDQLKKGGYSADFIQKCKDYLYNPGISVLKDALIANRFKINSMHDPTEGGLAAGLYEIALASGAGLLVEKEKIPVLPESQKLCMEYGLDPLRTISSGALLIAASRRNYRNIISALGSNGIKACPIGEVREKGYGIKIKTGRIIKDLEVSARDEIARIFK